MMKILDQTSFTKPSDCWDWPSANSNGFRVTPKSAVLAAVSGETAEIRGPGVHTRNGDTIELQFQLARENQGYIFFGFDADNHEHAAVKLDFKEGTLALHTSDWSRPQPVATVPYLIKTGEAHTILIEKTESGLGLVKNANFAIYVDGQATLDVDGLNVLPEMGVKIKVGGAEVQLQNFVHRGKPSSVPEFLNVGGWQMLNVESIEANLNSIYRGLRIAAERGVELLVTPETSITGLFPSNPVTTDPEPVFEAESRLRAFIHELDGAPYLVAGLPEWRKISEHRLQKTRYNISRVYDPDGNVTSTHTKVHSAERGFWHGTHLNEFDVLGVPVSMHICHDHRYPELWTLPVMFGTRLVLHPSNGGRVSGTVNAFQEVAKGITSSSHAFYINVNGEGGSYIVGPHRRGELLASSSECSIKNPEFPMVGPAEEGLFHARIRVHDAFGYWPVRSFRASEEIAKAYVAQYIALGGRHVP